MSIIDDGILVITLIGSVCIAYRIGFRNGRDVGQSDAYKLFSGTERPRYKKEESHTDAA